MNDGTRRLSVAIGNYPHTAAFKSGEIASPLFAFDFPEIKPVNRAFAPMARERRFDVSEMAIATVLQAIASGKLTPADGEAMARVLELRGQSIERVGLDARLRALEEERAGAHPK